MELFRKTRLKGGLTILRKRSAATKRNGNSFSFAKAVRIGILWDATHENSFIALSAFIKKMTETGKRVEVLAWIPGKEVPDRLTGLSYMKFLRTKDLGLTYIPKSADARAFMERKLDLLIDINPARVFPLTYIATLSNSPMKVGVDISSDSEQAPYDLMIQAGRVPDIAAFLEQAVHYLSLINAQTKG